MPYQQRTDMGVGRYLLVAGFAAVLVLMTMMTVLGLKKMADINQHLESIVNQHNIKTALVKQMRISARERVFTIQQMMLTDDPFEQDEAAMSIDELGARFASARIKFLQMPLSPHEHAMLDIQGGWAQEAVATQREAVNLIIGGKREEARKLLHEQVIPTQQKVLATLAQLEAKQDSAIEMTFKDAVATHRQARIQLIVLGALAVWLGILIAFYTVNRNHLIAKQLDRERERALVTLHSIGDGVITTDAQGTIEYLNPVAEQLIGWRSQTVEGKALLDIFRVVDGEDEHPLYHNLHQLLSQSQNDPLHQSMLLDAHHERLAIEFTASAIRGDQMELTGIVVTFRDVSEIRDLANHLSHQARHDSLTNLVNRREFELRLEQTLQRARQDDQHHALCFLDLDRFKYVNDRCGHAAGDELLVQLVEQLKKQIRSNDLLARLGGDEFGLLLENCPQEKALEIAEELRKAVNDYVFVWETQQFSVGVSIGMVMIDTNSGNLSEVIALADAACYSAKDSGRNRVHLYSANENESSKEITKSWLERLQTALHKNNFSLYCQSIVAVNPVRESMHLCELQLRFRDEQGQQIPPMAFIPVAERYHLMPAIDKWVLHHTCQLIHLVNDASAVYCLNLSLQTLGDTSFLPYAAKILQESGIDPGQICFEIKESDAIGDLQKIEVFIAQAREIGCRISLDDVGRSIGSYDYLKNLPVDFIKIDGPLINNVAHSTINNVQVKAITQIAHLLGICVIAEMVEDHNTLKLLGELGINYAQGFGIAKPRPVAELSLALSDAAEPPSAMRKG